MFCITNIKLLKDTYLIGQNFKGIGMKFTRMYAIEYAKTSRKSYTTKRKTKEVVSMLTITTLSKTSKNDDAE